VKTERKNRIYTAGTGEREMLPEFWWRNPLGKQHFGGPVR
jgi:hypothetical protein